MQHVYVTLLVSAMVAADSGDIPDRREHRHWNDFAKIVRDQERSDFLETELTEFERDAQIDCCVVIVPTIGQERIGSYVDRLVMKWKPPEHSVLVFVSQFELSYSVRLGDKLKNEDNRNVVDDIIRKLERARSNQELREAVADVPDIVRRLRKNP